MTTDLHFVARIGDEWVAMPAHSVESVSRIGAIVPVPGAPDVIRGMVAVRSRILTLVDTARLLGESPVADPADESMVVITVGGHGYGLTLSQIDDVVPISQFLPSPAHLSPHWKRLRPQLAEYRGQLLLVVEPAAVIEAITEPVPVT